MTPIVVLGVGNVLHADDGIGVRVVDQLAREYHIPASVGLVDAGTSLLDVLDTIAGVECLIVVDAVQHGQDPGSLYRMESKAALELFRSKTSLHQLGLLEVLSSLSLMGQSPGRTVLLGMEPESLELSMTLTQRVAEQMPLLVAAVEAELQKEGVVLSVRENTCEKKMAPGWERGGSDP